MRYCLQRDLWSNFGCEPIQAGGFDTICVPVIPNLHPPQGWSSPGIQMFASSCPLSLTFGISALQRPRLSSWLPFTTLPLPWSSPSRCLVSALVPLLSSPPSPPSPNPGSSAFAMDRDQTPPHQPCRGPLPGAPVSPSPATFSGLLSKHHRGWCDFSSSESKSGHSCSQPVRGFPLETKVLTMAFSSTGSDSPCPPTSSHSISLHLSAPAPQLLAKQAPTS